MERLREQATIFYSTHILSDVQRVSDTVAILKGGRLIKQAPVDALLSESKDVVYDVSLKGQVDAAHDDLLCKPWVTEIDTVSVNGRVQWYITVTSSDAAEAQLLPALMQDSQLQVMSFTRKQTNLEDVFLDLVTGENDESAS